jgi:hypothetical protein
MKPNCHIYTETEDQFIRENISGRFVPELTQLFNSHFGLNLTRSQIKSYVTNHKLKSGVTGAFIIPNEYPAAQGKFIRDNIAGKTVSELTRLFNSHFGLEIKESQIRAYTKNHKLKSGVGSQFTKGHTPFNKGKKGLYFGGVQTQFKKGQKPYNYLPVGSERVRSIRKNRPYQDNYIDVKIEDPNVWKAKHILIWEAHHGPVPKGHAVIFGDGNNRNFDPNNLILVSRKQLAVLNHKKLIQNDADLTRTAIVIADLYSKTYERTSKAKRVKKKNLEEAS